MQTQLPLFENRKPRMSSVNISGNELSEMLGAFEFDEEVCFVIRGVIKKVIHEERKLGEDDVAFIRTHNVNALEIIPVDHLTETAVIGDARLAQRERFGVPNMFDEAEKAKRDNVDPETGEVKAKRKPKNLKVVD